MAKVDNNIFIRGLTGSLGDQFILRKGKAGTTIITAKRSSNANREFSATQLAHQEAFREAIAYAKSSMDQEVYITKAEGTNMTPFNAAVADWFNKPQVLEINIEAWTGALGQVIRVRAKDDTRVANVKVQITDTDGTVLEAGEAVQAEGLWWAYTTQTTVTNPVAATINATAYDLPGNSHMLIWQNK